MGFHLFQGKSEELNSQSENVSRRGIGASTLIKVILTLVLLILVYSRIDIDVVLKKISSLDLLTVFLLLFLYFFSQVINSFKWRFFLVEAGINVSYYDVFRAFFLGMFLNTFGIGTIGGDLARAMAIPCQKGQRTACMATVLADRIYGLMTLLLIGSFSLIVFRPAYVPELFVMLLFPLLVLLFVLISTGPRLLLSFIPDGFFLKGKIEKAFSAFPRRARSLIAITSISIVFHCTQIFLAFKIFLALSSPISIYTAFCSIPFINIASSLPISVNGLGVREAVGIYILHPAGVLHEATVVFATVWVLVVTCVSAVIGAMIIPGYGKNIMEIIRYRKEESQTPSPG
jgi:uncharacterized membrane protein YbhN (UPF0104 family)